MGDIFFGVMQLKTDTFGSSVDVLEQEPRGGALVAWDIVRGLCQDLIVSCHFIQQSGSSQVKVKTENLLHGLQSKYDTFSYWLIMLVVIRCHLWFLVIFLCLVI
jgi:hypothetical protein